MNKIAILIPCYNEEITVQKVVNDFKKELPSAEIYVYDNNSSDNTAQLASEAGAIVRKCYQQGKGYVVRNMFNEIEADCYVLVDGDDTYPASQVHKLIDGVLNEKVDMVIGDRLSNGTYANENKRGFHNFGNNLVRALINNLFHSNINDIMTGYRAYSRKFVKCVPIMSNGFQIETEMSVFSVVYGLNIKEIPIIYRDRPVGSDSKLNTFSDGFKVLLTLFNLFKDYRPLLFFSITGLIFFILSLLIGVPVVNEFYHTGFILKMPSAILAASLMVIAILNLAIGLIMDAIKNQSIFNFKQRVNLFYQLDNINNNK